MNVDKLVNITPISLYGLMWFTPRMDLGYRRYRCVWDDCGMIVGWLWEYDEFFRKCWSIIIPMGEFGFDTSLQECSNLWLVYDNDHVRAIYLCLVSTPHSLRPSMALSHSVTISASSACRICETVKQILPFGNSKLLLKMVTFNAQTHYKRPLLIAMFNHQRVHGDVWQLEVLIRRNLLDFDVPSLSWHVEYPKSGEVTLIFTTFYKVHLWQCGCSKRRRLSSNAPNGRKSCLQWDTQWVSMCFSPLSTIFV